MDEYVDILVATYNDGKELTITLTDGYDNPIVNTVIFVDLNGTKPYITDEKGQIKISHENLTPNTYKVNVKFMEDSFYRESNVATTIIINKIGTNINADAVTREYIFANEYVFIITDDDGNPAGNVSVVIDLNGSDEFTTDENGQIKLDLNADNSFEIIIKYAGDDKYRESSNTNKITFITSSIIII